MFFKLRFRSWLWIVALLFQLLFLRTWTRYTVAEDEQKEPTYPVDVMSIQTVLVDSNDQPIADVKATVFGVRCLEDRGSWYSWPSSNIGKVQDSQSQGDGKVEFRYPIKFGVPEKWLTTSTLDITFSHPDYVPERTEIKLENIPEKIKLKSGCKVQLSAIDESGKPIERFFPMVAGRDSPTNWVFSTGITRTGSMTEGKQKCMLACPSESGTLFSKLIAFETTHERMVSIPNILVRPGKRVFGTLPDYVPRPIVDGSVSINALMESEEPLGGNEPVNWSDWTIISEDGSFELRSVPGPAQVQVIAICRGWVIQSLEKNNRVKGKTFDFNKEQPELNVEFEMEQTGDIRIELMNADGESISGAKVSTWPNKVNLTGGSTTLTSEWRTIDYIDRMLKGETNWSLWGKSSTNRHSQVSDDEGMVTLRDIPVGMEESINVQHPKYDLPYEIGSVGNEIKYKVKPGETEERLLVLQKRGSAN